MGGARGQRSSEVEQIKSGLQEELGEPTYMDFLQSRDEQVRRLRNLAESQAGDRNGPLVQGQGFTVTVSGDVTFGQNHAAICEA